mmetsp:Transcript_1786/g.1913  ORF Transcript_1786/g.1913 Transcript_1786/m.1913 type:complete len:213 (-) Transcript_1786:58-696(-)
MTSRTARTVVFQRLAAAAQQLKEDGHHVPSIAISIQAPVSHHILRLSQGSEFRNVGVAEAQAADVWFEFASQPALLAQFTDVEDGKLWSVVSAAYRSCRHGRTHLLQLAWSLQRGPSPSAGHDAPAGSFESSTGISPGSAVMVVGSLATIACCYSVYAFAGATKLAVVACPALLPAPELPAADSRGDAVAEESEGPADEKSETAALSVENFL